MSLFFLDIDYFHSDVFPALSRLHYAASSSQTMPAYASLRRLRCFPDDISDANSPMVTIHTSQLLSL